jgi:hypothetical protein
MLSLKEKELFNLKEKRNDLEAKIADLEKRYEEKEKELFAER